MSCFIPIPDSSPLSSSLSELNDTGLFVQLHTQDLVRLKNLLLRLPGKCLEKKKTYNTTVQIAFHLTAFIITDKESLSDREIAL